MTALGIGVVSILAIVALIYSGLHIAVALALTSFVGVWLIKGHVSVAGDLLALAAKDSIASYDFAVIPLFVLMGLLVSAADIGRDAFNAANQVFRRIRGGLGIATVASNAVFAAVTGVSIASAAVFTKIAVPQMLRLGYKPRFAVGIVAGSSVLGMLIPPSLLLIIFGILSEASIGKLFIAGVLPGLLLAVMFAVLVYVMAGRPGAVTREAVGGEAESLLGAGELLQCLLPIALLVTLVIGGIYSGLFTPTEAGGVGALGALVLALARRKLTWDGTWQLFLETAQVTAAICILVIAASMYSRMLAMSGVPAAMSEWIGGSGFGLYLTLALYLGLLLLLGTFLDSASILLLVVPLALPVFQAFDVNVIWFGLVTILAVEIGIITPPLGIAVFVVKGTLDDPRITLEDVFAGAMPFVLVMLLCLGLLVAFPGIVLALVP